MIKKESNQEYHSNKEYLGKGVLMHYLKSPAEFKYYFDNYKYEESTNPTFIFGSAYHIAILQPELINTNIFIYDENNRTDMSMTMAAKANKEWKQNLLQSNQDKIIININDWNVIVEMKKVLFQSELIKILLSGGEAELSYYHLFDGVKIKVKPDYIKKNAIIDLKTIAGGSDKDNFVRACSNYYYDVQASLYYDVIQDHDKIERQFLFIAQAKDPPYLFGVFRASDSMLSVGRYLHTEILTMHKYCLENNVWKSNEIYSDNELGIIDIDIPAWRIKELKLNYKL